MKDEHFLRLFLRNESILRSYARSLLPSWEGVDDVLQEASVVMWKKLSQLEDAEGFLPWSKVIVRLECLKARRKMARETLVFSDEVYALIADEFSFDDEDSMQQRAQALSKCLSQIDERTRSIILAPYSGYGSVKSLAKNLKRTENSLYKQIGRLREKLASCVKKQLPTPVA